MREKDELSTKGNPCLLGKFKFRTALFGAAVQRFTPSFDSHQRRTME